jgi:molybdopterin synthase catalytic subunit
MIELTRSPIDIHKVAAAVASSAAGATVLFLGTTREFTMGRQTVCLDYEAHEPLARIELDRLQRLAMEKWPGSNWCIVHRLGRVELGEASVAIAVSTPHRRDAFEAASWMIDRLKETVPIWKEEHGPDGATEWIHPVFASEPDSSSRDVPAASQRKPRQEAHG